MSKSRAELRGLDQEKSTARTDTPASRQLAWMALTPLGPYEKENTRRYRHPEVAFNEETWLCYECAQRCTPDRPHRVFRVGFKTFALHDRCVDSYSAKSEKPYHVALPPEDK